MGQWVGGTVSGWVRWKEIHIAGREGNTGCAGDGLRGLTSSVGRSRCRIGNENTPDNILHNVRQTTTTFGMNEIYLVRYYAAAIVVSLFSTEAS